MTSGAVGELPVDACTRRPPTSPSRNLRMTSCARARAQGFQGSPGRRSGGRAPRGRAARARAPLQAWGQELAAALQTLRRSCGAASERPWQQVPPVPA